MTTESLKDQKDPRKEYRFPVPFENHFHAGLYQLGEVRADTEYTGDPNRVGPHKRDPVTGLLQWKITVSDPAVRNARRASYEITLLANEEPVPTTAEIGNNLRPITLTDVTLQPRTAGQNEFKYLDYTVRATGYAPAPGPRSSGSAAKSA
ncbi:hypothetical protein OIE68_23215 [Nocardia vinacea]|uniref:hypothetical protein n=1 Tax=Nocardia vinacea TaxID=96468 RepID=UPI002E0ED920|nr:hypothetical protein OIE68_23215 [Nocardia vinacea]